MNIMKGFLFSLLLATGFAQAATINLSVSPATTTVHPGASFSINILGDISASAGFSSLDAGGVLLNYDPAIVTANSPVTYGPSLLDLGTIIDNSAGQTALAFGSFSGLTDQDPVKGGIQFLLATLNMTAGSLGSTSLALAVDPGNPFVHDFVVEIAAADIISGSGQVNVVPLPAAAWLMISGLGLMGLRFRRSGA